jgi:alkyl sulfatase-like protein
MAGLDTWVRTGDRIGSESGAQSGDAMFVDGPHSPPKPPSPWAKIDRFVLHSQRDRGEGHRPPLGDTDSPGLEVAGDADALASLLAVLDRPDPSFNIVTP